MSDEKLPQDNATPQSNSNQEKKNPISESTEETNVVSEKVDATQEVSIADTEKGEAANEETSSVKSEEEALENSEDMG